MSLTSAGNFFKVDDLLPSCTRPRTSKVTPPKVCKPVGRLAKSLFVPPCQDWLNMTLYCLIRLIWLGVAFGSRLAKCSFGGGFFAGVFVGAASGGQSFSADNWSALTRLLTVASQEAGLS